MSRALLWLRRAFAGLRNDPGPALPPVPRVCLHPNETIDASRYAVVAFKCLDCREVRVLGEVYFGASNKRTRRPA